MRPFFCPLTHLTFVLFAGPDIAQDIPHHSEMAEEAERNLKGECRCFSNTIAGPRYQSMGRPCALFLFARPSRLQGHRGHSRLHLRPAADSVGAAAGSARHPPSLGRARPPAAAANRPAATTLGPPMGPGAGSGMIKRPE